MKSIKNISTFGAFSSFNYTMYFIGRSVSQFGTWMQRTAVVWVMYTLTHSPFMLGLTIFAEQFPSFIFSAFGGVAADRYNRYKIVNITQIASMAQATLLAILVMTKHYVIWEILALSVVLGIINAYDIPARQTMINEVVSNEDDLPSALSLSAAMASVAKLLGPALSGFILESYGAGICFLINAASFGGVMLSISLMKIPKTSKQKTSNRPQKNVFAELAEGFAYLRKESSIGWVIVMVCFTSLFVVPYDTLIPVFAKVIFKGNAQTFGYISSFIGIGAIGGTVLLASLKKEAPLRKVLLWSTVVLGIGLICFSRASNFSLAMLFAVFAGFGGVAQFTTCNIIVQSEASSEMRGRAISILLTAIFGMLPLGSLIVGSISERIGAPTTLLCQGIAGLIIAAAFAKILSKKKEDKKLPLQENFVAEEDLMEAV